MSKVPGVDAAIDQAFRIIMMAAKSVQGVEPDRQRKAVEVIDGQLTVLREMLLDAEND
jgi:hypothetical protein